MLDVVEEEDKSESESSSEYEEYTDSEDETGPRLKPVFVPRTDRVTIKEKEAQAKEEQAVEQEKKKQSDLRKRESHRVRQWWRLLVAQAIQLCMLSCSAVEISAANGLLDQVR